MFGYQNKRESGAIVIDGQQVASTFQCVHCGSHEEIIPGSKRKRAFCMFCNGFVCGKKECMVHIPHEAKLDFADAKTLENTKVIGKLKSKYPGIDRINI